MPWSVTLAGETFTDANVAGTAYADEATGFPAIIAAFAREAAFLKGLAATSSTLLTPATGAVQLTTHQDAANSGLSPGMVVRVASVADSGRQMVGTVAAYAGNTLGLDVVFATGPAAADWLITRPSGGPSIALDQQPTLAADLDADGWSIVNAAGASFSGEVKLGGRLRVDAAGEAKCGRLGEVAGEVLLRPSDPTTLACTIAGDTTFLVAGADTPGYEHSHKIRATIGGAGGWNVTVLPASRLTNGNDLTSTLLDTGWTRGDLDAAAGAASPAGPAWTLTAAGAGNVVHYMIARRPPVAAAPFDYVASALVKAGTGHRVRLRLVVDTYAHGGWVDADLVAGTVTGTGVNSAGTVLGYGIRPVADGWHLLWVATDVATAGVDLSTVVYLLNAAGAESYVQAGESILFGGATLGTGTSYQGFQHIGASRTATVRWQGRPIDWPSLAAGQAVDLMIQCEPDRIVQQDYTPEEI